jgi:hypothetical protein
LIYRIVVPPEWISLQKRPVGLALVLASGGGWPGAPDRTAFSGDSDPNTGTITSNGFSSTSAVAPSAGRPIVEFTMQQNFDKKDA